MFSTAGILFSGFLFCLVGSFFSFALLARKNIPTFKAPTIIIALLTSLSIALFCILPQASADFITEINALSLATPIGVVMGLTLLALVSKSLLIQFIFLTLGCFSIVFGCNISIVFSEAFPVVVNQTLTAILWIAICYCPRVLNLNTEFLSIQTLTFGLGSFLLFLLNALPLGMALSGLCLSGCFLALIIATKQNSNLQISDYICSLVGFILGWLIIYSSVEGCGSCFLIFGMYPLLEIIIAMSQRLTFLPRFAIAKNNTMYLRVVDEEMTPELLNRYLARINLICILFGAFQIFAPNNYSIPCFSMVIVLWQTYRIYNWRNQPESLKETNKKFIREVKENIQEISATFRDKGK